MNGSGTTMLLDSLGRHPEVYAFPQETRLLPYVIQSSRKLGDLVDDRNFYAAWKMVQQIPVFADVNDGMRPPIPDDWADYPKNIGAVIDAFFRFFALEEGKVRWCEKTPQHVQHLDILGAVFPSAKFVHLIRDGRACAASFHRRWRRTPQLTIYRWKKVVNEGREQGANLGNRYLELRYEAVTSDPERWMRTLCEFLELEFDPVILKSRQPQSRNRDTPGTIRENRAAWADYFSSKTTRQLERISGSYLKELGYDTRNPSGSWNPPKAQLELWRARDLLWQFLFLMKFKAQGKRRLSWRRVFIQPLAAFRQAKINKY
jgi:hypothetical protein